MDDEEKVRKELFCLLSLLLLLFHPLSLLRSFLSRCALHHQHPPHESHYGDSFGKLNLPSTSTSTYSIFALPLILGGNLYFFILPSCLLNCFDVVANSNKTIKSIIIALCSAIILVASLYKLAGIQVGKNKWRQQATMATAASCSYLSHSLFLFVWPCMNVLGASIWVLSLSLSCRLFLSHL